MAFEFLPLSYDFNDLRPAMTEKVARWHHDVVHGAYLAEINRLLSQYPDFNGLTIEQVLSQPHRLPDNIRDDVRVQGGGHANHQFMWKILGARRGTQPTRSLGEKLDARFGGFAAFVLAFKTEAMALDGDGWAFLSLSAPRASDLEIVVTRGNGNVLELRKPGVLICDLWQHAYHDDHRDDREAWIDFFLEAVDWMHCSLRYDRLVAGEPVP